MTPEQKMVKARAGLVLDQPFFGSLALRLALTPDPSCPTAWTDGTRLGYNPEWIADLPLDLVKGVIAHEVMHLAACHHLRRQDRDPKTWNIAGDHAINLVLKDAGIPLIEGAFADPKFKDQCAEKIYAALDSQKPKNEEGPSQPQGAGGTSNGRKPAPARQKGDRKGNPTKSDPGMMGEVRDARKKDGSVPSESERRQMAADWKIATAQAAKQAQAMGKMPGSLNRLVEETLDPKMDWREILRRFVNQNTKNDYAWTPPNRRFVHMGLYLPSLRSQEIDRVVVVMDTSGSIKQSQVDEFAAELTGIVETLPSATTTVIYCDAKVRRVEHFQHHDLPLRLNPKGGGGTNFQPPFQWLEENTIDTTCLIYFTDGICHLYPDPPDFPVLWLATRRFTPPFGEIVEMY